MQKSSSGTIEYMTLTSTFWDNKRKYFTLVGLLLVLLVVVASVLITGKLSADKQAYSHAEQLSKYAQSLTLTKDNRLGADTAKQPSLPGSAFAFLSASYRAQEAKQAAIEESVAQLKAIDSSYDKSDKNELRATIYYDQSSFFFDSDGARLEASTKVRQLPPTSTTEEAAAYADMYRKQSKAATDYIATIEKKSAGKAIYKKETELLVEVLRTYKKEADGCQNTMSSAKKSDEVDTIVDKCSDKLNKKYRDADQLYSYLAFYPRSLKLTTSPSSTLIAQIKKQSEQSYEHKSVQEARIEARLSNRAEIAKMLLPASGNDQNYTQKVDILQTLNRQSKDDLDHATISSEIKSRFQKKLNTTRETITYLYRNSKKNVEGEWTSPLTDSIIAIMERSPTKQEIEKEVSRTAFNTETKKQLAAMELPDYLKDEMQSILSYYDKAKPHLEKSDSYEKAASKVARDLNRDIDDALAINAQAEEEFNKANAYLNAAHQEVIKKIQGKLDTSPYPRQQVIKLYDDFLRP